MNDYSFGNYMYEKRKETGESQNELGRKLGVTGKAVSKWENGAAKPKTEILRKLAVLWNVSIEELLRIREGEKKKSISKIVITGGPCAGKTTGMSWIQNAFTERGYTVLFIPEIATELISGGVAPWTCGSNGEYQKCQLKLQMEKEKVFEYAARTMDSEKILIVCDRGALDNKAYMTDAEFAVAANYVGANEVELRDGYDAVFHLVTAAKGAQKFYTTANNTARTETPEEAAALDDKLIAAWTGHPHLRIIDNAEGFEEKMKCLIKEIALFLGEPEPYEIERKYLIEYPEISALEALPNCEKVEIIQTYLQADHDDEVRIRQRGSRGNYIYFETRKKTISGLKRIEIERRLTKDEYLERLMDADPTRMPIRKDRYCLADGNQYFEIDIYPFWNDQAILEIELSDPEEEIRFPKMLKVIREVTEDEAYKNASLAKL
ncbi:MAG TPA: AAA family ATPase [Candidatus Anaerostipes avistercoris]|uniref:AAA family ATPase n=1 Tax=Candidatus Anaerostipes avistercoris TaxID=2838462 RepID=A0A9D2PG80_9FIRM|nr:AAA family ATPase [Candidatus Anaerostipes avistercoris]